MKMFVTLLLISLTSLTLGSDMDKCPDPADTRLILEDNTDSVLTSYNRLRSSGRLNGEANVNYLNEMEASDKECKQPLFPDDDPNAQPQIAKRAVSPVRDFIQIAAKRTCEPCPAKQHFLGRFFRSCYVLAPSQQQVRYVTCNRRCFAPCMCSRSYCQRTPWVRVWFFSFCVGTPGQTFPAGYRPGLNFRYLWLPQDCTCRNV